MGYNKLKDLPVGEKVKDLGWSYDGKTVIWDVVATDHNTRDSGYPANGITLFSNTECGKKELSIGQTSFPTNKLNTGNPQQIGYALFDTGISCIHDWLNSTDTSWVGKFPNKPSYDSEKGFLGIVSEKFRAKILDTTIKKYRYNTMSWTRTTPITETLKVFLPSVQELGLENSANGEGKQILYFNVGNKDAYIKKDSNGTVTQYALRTPANMIPISSYVINVTGTFAQSRVNLKESIFPMLNLDGDIPLANNGEPDSDGVYILDLSDGVIWPEIIIYDALENKTPITDGKEFTNGKHVKPSWDEITGATSKPTLYYNADTTATPTQSISFTKAQELSKPGIYKLSVKFTDAGNSNNTKTKEVTFKIIPGRSELENLEIYDKETSTIIDDTDGIEDFYGSCTPTWKDPTNATVTYTLSLGTSIISWTKETKLTTIGEYTLSYTLTDKNYPSNILTNSVRFNIKPEKEDFDFDLKLRDKIQNVPINEGSQFDRQIQVTWDEPPSTVSYTYTMSRNNTSLTNFTKDGYLSDVGKYQITFYFTDKNYPTNKSTKIVNFEIIKHDTNLDEFELIFYNAMKNPNEIITENKQYREETVKPIWDPNLPIDVSVSSYTFYTNTILVPSFNPGTSTVTEVAKYRFIVNLKNESGNVKEYVRNFEIVKNTVDFGDLNLEFYNFLTGQVMHDGDNFIEQQVLPDWKIDSTVVVNTYDLTYEGQPYYFIRRETVLFHYGEYELTLHLEDVDNPAHIGDKSIKFTISPRPSDLNRIELPIYNAYTMIEIHNGDKYKGINVKPIWDVNDELPSTVDYVSFIDYNNTGNRNYNQTNGDDFCSQPGQYLLTIVLTDRVSKQDRTITRNFEILPNDQDLSNVDIIIKNQLTNQIITEGQIFRGIDAKVQPTWEQIPTLNYTYKLSYNNNPLNDYIKGDILRNKGTYYLEVVAFDPNYPDHRISKSVTFIIADNVEDELDSSVEAYLNGLPYTMGTPITKSGCYNLLVAKRKSTNFKVAISEVNFKVVNPADSQKPLIIVLPGVIPAIKDTITIRYPEYSTEREYKINTNGLWKNYTNEFDVTDNCVIFARCKDSIGYITHDFKEVTNIDKTPPDPPIILGFKPGVDTYYTVSPIAKPVFGVEFSATLNGEPYELGTPIVNENEEIKHYTLVVTAKKLINGLTSRTTISFYLDSTPPAPPIFKGFIPDQIQEVAYPDIVENVSRANPTPLIMQNYLGEPINALYIDDINLINANSEEATTLTNELTKSIDKSAISLLSLTNNNEIITDAGVYASAVDIEYGIDVPHIGTTEVRNGIYYITRLNNRPFTLGDRVDEDGTYQISCTAVKELNGMRATSVAVFYIQNPEHKLLEPPRPVIIPLIEENKDWAIDGELVVQRDTSHISLYDDGHLISKTKELELIIGKLTSKINKLIVNLNTNKARIKMLLNLRFVILDLLNSLSSRNFEIKMDIQSMNNSFADFEFEDLSCINEFNRLLSEISIKTSEINMRIGIEKSRILNKVEEVLSIIDQLLNNSSMIAQIIWIKQNRQ